MITPEPPLIVGNWKMNGGLSSEAEFGEVLESSDALSSVQMILCPPATLLRPFAALKGGKRLMLGAQDCHHEEAGAYTGDLSAPILADAGAQAVILGHSERRMGHGEKDDLILKKCHAAERAGLFPILCIGETAEAREKGETLPLLQKQLRCSLPSVADLPNLAIAYEPVWAIGSGRTPTEDEISFIKKEITSYLEILGRKSVPILYGGSVTPQNAKGILNLVEGALIGGASLKASDFLEIARAAA